MRVAYLVILALCSVYAAAADCADPDSLASYISDEQFPSYFLIPADTNDNFLNKARVTDYSVDDVIENGTGIGSKTTIKTTIPSTTDFKVHGLDNFVLRLDAQSPEFVIEEHNAQSSDPNNDYRLRIEISPVAVTLRYTGNAIHAVKKTINGTDVSFGDYAPSSPVYPEISASGKIVIQYNWDGGVSFAVKDASTGNDVAFTVSSPLMIGDTGIVLDVTKASVHLSDEENAQPVGGLPANWRGVVFDQLAVYFTGPVSSDSAGMVLKDFAIGTGGVSGEISGTTSKKIKLGGSDFTLKKVDVVLKQNAFVKSEISGSFDNFPFFDQPIALDLSIGNKGAVLASIAPSDRDASSGLKKFEIPNVADLFVDSMSVEFADRVAYLTVNGRLKPTFSGAFVETGNKEIPINGLRVSTKGDVQLAGGWSTLPQKVSFTAQKLFKLDVAQFALGTEKTDQGTERKWFGFTGSLDLETLGGNAEFEKLKVSWNKSTSSGLGLKVAVERVKVQYEQKGALAFEGEVNSFEDTFGCGFSGNLMVDLKGMGIRSDARLIVGKGGTGTNNSPALSACDGSGTVSNPFKFFYVDLEMTKASGVPLGGNVALYGLLGMFAKNMEPDLYAFDTPVQWYRAHRAASNVLQVPTGYQHAPWKTNPGALALGVGALIGTQSDAGYAANVKAAITLVTPGPIVMISGLGNILKKPTDLDNQDTPLFEAVAVFDNRAKKFLLNLSVAFEKPDDGATKGELVDLGANTELYVNLENASDWHLYLGQEDESKRIAATIVKFLRANAYFMIEPSQLKFGSSVGYDSAPKWKFGPLRVHLAAWLKFAVSLSRRPTHVWGSADLGGTAELKAFGVGCSILAQAGLGFEAPTPFVLSGDLHVKLQTPKFIPDPEADIHLEWRKDRPKPAPEAMVRVATLENSLSQSASVSPLKRGDALATNATSVVLCTPGAESFNGCDAPSVPVYDRPSIAFYGNMNDETTATSSPFFSLVGNNGSYEEKAGANSGWRYQLNSLQFSYAQKDGNGTWHPMPQVYGAWAALAGDTSEASATALMLGTKNPFSVYAASAFSFYQSGGGFDQWLTGAFGSYPCEADRPSPSQTSEALSAIAEANRQLLVALAAANKAIGGAMSSLLELLGLPADTKLPCGCDTSFSEQIAAQLQQAIEDLTDLKNDQSSIADCLDPEVLSADDLILPPYRVFGVQINTTAAPLNGETQQGTYTDTFYLQTDGAPLDLAPFIQNTVPGDLSRRHYRADLFGLRFNQTWIDLLYRDPVASTPSAYTGPNQKFVFRVVDENGVPVTDADGVGETIVTSWRTAPDHIRPKADQAFLDFLSTRGVTVNAAASEKDDMAYGRLADWTGLKPNKQYTVEVWLEDPRLANDRRLTLPNGSDNSAWRSTNVVRAYDAKRPAVMLYSYALRTSNYQSFTKLVQSYQSGWWKLDAPGYGAPSVPQLLSTLTPRGTFQNGSFANSAAPQLGRYFALANPSLAPDGISAEKLRDLLRLNPVYAGNADQLTEQEERAIRSEWTADRSSFAELDETLQTHRVQEPSPSELEVSVITDAQDHKKALLLEFPEEVDWSRIDVFFTIPSTIGWPTIIPTTIAYDRSGKRVFIARADGADLTDTKYQFLFNLRRVNGNRNPILLDASNATTEVTTIDVDLSKPPLKPEAR